MQPELEFLLGLLDRDDSACVSTEDYAGEQGEALRLWQRLGFLSKEAERQPVPSCPHCWEGVPYPLGGREVCDACLTAVDPRHLLLWRFDLEAFIAWLARALKLEGRVRRVEERLWQLGSFTGSGTRYECFVCRTGSLTERGRDRLLAYRSVLLLRLGLSRQPLEGFHGLSLFLLEVLARERRTLRVRDLRQLLRGDMEVRFDEATGTLSAGGTVLGTVAIGSKESHLLGCLAERRDRFVPYADLKHYVLTRTGSTDTTDEAGFCQKLKHRIKQRIPAINRLINTTNKAEGYCLRSALAGEP